MRPTLLLLVALAVGSLLAVSQLRAGGPEYYSCTVKEIHRLEDNGRLAVWPANEQGGFGAKVGDTFSVDRQTGSVIGNHEQSTARAVKVTVHDRGSSNSYFTMSWERPRDVYVLHIRETAIGADKPFLLAGALEVVTGTCR